MMTGAAMSGPPMQVMGGGMMGGGGAMMGGMDVMGGMGGGGGMMMQQQQQGMECEVFVEVTPEVVPNFNRGQNGTFYLEVPPITVRLATQCNPPPPMAPGMVPFKPYEEFPLHFPELQFVEFNPQTRQPPNATACARSTKRGAVLEVPRQVGLNAQLKANSPHGQLILEDLQVQNGYKQKIGENVMNYKLQVEGELSMNPNGGNSGAHRLEVNLNFTFWAQLQSGGGAAQMQTGQAFAGGQMMGMGMQPMVVQEPPMMMAAGPPMAMMGGPMAMAGPPMAMMGGPPMAMGGGPMMMAGGPMGGPMMGGGGMYY